jgi:hypothetical protein
MGFGDISYLGICAEILNWKVQAFLVEEQLSLSRNNLLFVK